MPLWSRPAAAQAARRRSGGDVRSWCPIGEEEEAMRAPAVALDARVSSEQPAEAKTIARQLADLRARIAADGFDPAAALSFVDEGYRGAHLVRPALERLRDVAAAGDLQRLDVHCPDRLARNYAHQVVLLEELTRAGVE